MNTEYIFKIDGGAGKLVAALESMTAACQLSETIGWVISGHKEFLENNLYLKPMVSTEPMSRLVKGRELITLEPYHVKEFYEGNINLQEAFKKILFSEYSSMPDVQPLMLHEDEELFAKSFLKRLGKCVLIQPFGASAQVQQNGTVFDNHYRSLSAESFIKLVDNIPQGWTILYAGMIPVTHPRVVSLYPSWRYTAAIVKNVDYVVSIDSSIQHIAKAVGQKNVSTIFCSTSAKSFGYEEFHNQEMPKEEALLFGFDNGDLNRFAKTNEVPDQFLINIIERLK